jgi:hypothetical protein
MSSINEIEELSPDSALSFCFHTNKSPIGLGEAVELSNQSVYSDHDLQLLTLPESRASRVMIRQGSNSIGFPIQKTFSISPLKIEPLRNKNWDDASQVEASVRSEVSVYDFLLLTGVGLSTWLLRNILKNQ